MPAMHRSLRVWLNAFIPGHVPGYTDQLTSGPHAGKTVIYGLSEGSAAYLTDQRMFSGSLDAPCQIHTQVHVDLVAGYRTTARHFTDFATAIGADGEPGAPADSDESRLAVTLATPRTISSHPALAKAVGVLPFRPVSGSAAGEPILLHFTGLATPACPKMAAHFGDIGYDGVLLFDRAKGMLEFVGQVHRFPAFEMYASLDGGAPVTIFRLSPPRGSTALHRAGPGMRPVKASVPFGVSAVR